MVSRKDVLDLSYYAKNVPFSGSDCGKRYRIEKIKIDEKELLQATVWPEPYSFEATAEEKKKTQTAPFSEEGMCLLLDYINAYAPGED